MAKAPLSDNWRRTRCRIVFLLLCILPTATSIYWIFHPQTAEQWEIAIQAELGLPASVDLIETPGPYVTILRGVTFKDSQFGELFSSAQVRVIRGSNANRVIIDHPTRLSSQALSLLIQQASDQLIRSDHIQKTWSIEFTNTATIYSGDPESNYAPPLVMSDLHILINRYLDGPVAEIGFHREDDPGGNAVYANIQHGLDGRKRFELRTGQVKLPCWLIADFCPDLKHLGSECQFGGIVEIRPSDQDINDIETKIQGTFSDINLAALVEPFRHHLTGDTCTATVQNYVRRNGKTFSVSASIYCPGGTIGMDLIESAKSNLNFEFCNGIEKLSQNGAVGFRHLKMDFEITDGNLKMWGTHPEGLMAYSANEEFGIARCSANQKIESLAMFLVRPGGNEQLVSEEMLNVLDRFHRPSSPPITPSLPVRVAEEPQKLQNF